MTADRSLPSAAAIVEEGLACSKADACIVIVTESFDADVRFANNETTTNGTRRSRQINVVSITDRVPGPAVGVASRSGPVAIEQLIRAAEKDAAGAPVAEDASELSSGGLEASFSEAPETTDLSIFSELLADLGGAFERARAAERRLAGFANHQVATTYLGCSTGLGRRFVDRTGSLELVARTDDGASSAWAGVGSPTFSDVSLPALEAKLIGRLTSAARRIDLPAGRYEVILPPDAVADLVIESYSAMSGRDAEDGGNVYSGSSGGTRIGERLFALPFQLYSDPSIPSLACAPYLATGASGSDVSVFDNGAPIERTEWIRDGRLERLRYHRAAARRSGTTFAPFIDNLVLALPGSTGTLEDLVRHTERGLLLTCLWYIREVDPATLLLTGLTRDGVYLVEGGEIVGAVNNFRFNASPLDVLSRVIEAGSTEQALSREWNEWLSKTAMPPIRVADFNMSSVSPAN